jgi:NADH dehydrogenase [ubiquinone] 1 alpha subcomplex assembly factor 6
VPESRQRAGGVTVDRPPSGLSYCAAQVRRLDRDRYLTALLAPAAAREGLLALYALNVELARVRESISEPLVGQIRLQWWRDSIDGIYAGEPRRHAVLAPLAAAIERHALPQALFADMIEARELDMEPGPPATLSALLDYADRTAGTLLALALVVLGAGDTDGGTGRAGRAVGQAWVLAGIVRAVPFHARDRRLYLPADLLDRHGVRQRDVLELRPSPGLAGVARELADLARAKLAEARRVAVPRRLLSPFLLASLADEHLRRLAQAGYDVFDPRIVAAPPRRLFSLLLRSWLGRF